jgi:homoserine trans-succinylase
MILRVLLLEHLEFEEVDYWEGFARLWNEQNQRLLTWYICWGVRQDFIITTE